MTNKQWYWFWKIVKFILMLAVPAGYAIIKWGFISEPTNNTAVGKWALGGFIAAILVGQFVIDLVKQYIEQYKLNNRVSFMRNHAGMYIVLGLIFLGAYFIAWDAMIFCAVAGASSLLAYIAQFLEKRYYKKLGEE